MMSLSHIGPRDDQWAPQIAQVVRYRVVGMSNSDSTTLERSNVYSSRVIRRKAVIERTVARKKVLASRGFVVVDLELKGQR